MLFASRPQVHILHSDSTTALTSILREVPSTMPIFFFLDAHFPGEVEVGYNYEENTPNGVTMPLQEELQLIRQLRPNAMDVIVVDDLKLYEDGPFENGQILNNFANIPPSWRNLDFVHVLFPDKTIEKSYLDDGYLILKPHSSNFSLKKL